MKNNQSPHHLLGFRLDPNDPYKITPQEVTEEVYFALGRPIWRHQKKMQAQGKCRLPGLKWMWKCDADCEFCEYQCAGRELRLDREHQNADGDSYREGDTLPSEEPTPEAIAVEHITLGRLLERLSELCPDAIAAGMVMADQNISQRKAMDLLGMNRTTFRSQLDRVEKQVCQEFGVDSIDELL